MKRFITYIIAMLICMQAIPLVALAQDSDIYILVNYRYAFVNNELIPFGEAQNIMPIIEDGKTLVPLSFIEQYLNVAVEKDDLKVIAEVAYAPIRKAVEKANKQLYFSPEQIIVISNKVWNDEMFGKNKDEIIYSLKLSERPMTNDDEDKTLTDIQKLQYRLKRDYINDKENPYDFLKYMNEDGSFSNVNYSPDVKGSFPAVQHLTYLQRLGQAYNSPGNKYYKSSVIKQKYILALLNWVENDYHYNLNWWNNDQQVPKELSVALLVKVPGIPDQLLNNAYKIVRRCERLGGYQNGSGGGTDLVLASRTLLNLSISLADEENIQKRLDTLFSEIYVVNPVVATDGSFVGLRGGSKVGIFPDMGYYYHGPLIHTGAYGHQFIQDASYIISLTAGTKFQPSSERLNILIDYILDGVQYQIRNKADDPGVKGRFIVNLSGSDGDIAGGLNSALGILLKTKDLNRQEELSSLYNNRLGVNDVGFVGTKNFWFGDYFSHNRNAYHIGVRTSSVRTKVSESINWANMKGANLGDGVTYIQTDGKDYASIYPVWDWNMLPGTTTTYGDFDDWNKRSWQGSWNDKGSTQFVGGVTDGIYGANCMDFQKKGLRAKKSWFMFDEGMVALGDEINYGGDFPIYTDVNQARLYGNVTVSDEKGVRIVEKGTRELKNVSWVLHNNIGYLFPTPTTINLKNDAQTGRQSDINQSSSSADVTFDVFNLWINHGNKPSNKNYQYMVLPGATKELLEEYATNSPYIIDTKKSYQAVFNKKSKVLEVVFWESGSADIDGLKVSIDKPCIVTVSDIEKDIKIAVANPMNEGLTVNLGVNRMINSKYAKVSGDSSVLEFVLPGDDSNAGRSVYFSEKTGFSIDKNRYDEELAKPKAPNLIGITVDGEVIKNFSPVRKAYQIRTKKEPDIKAFGGGEITIKKSETKPDTFDITIASSDDKEIKSTYQVGYKLPITVGLPDADLLDIVGVTAGNYSAPATPENTIDDDISDESRWSTDAEHDAWIQYDLGKVQAVDYLAMAVAFADKRQTIFSVSTSTDGATWQKVYDGRSSGKIVGYEVYTLIPTKARYVKIQGYGNSAPSPWTSINEVKWYSKKNS